MGRWRVPVLETDPSVWRHSQAALPSLDHIQPRLLAGLMRTSGRALGAGMVSAGLECKVSRYLQSVLT